MSVLELCDREVAAVGLDSSVADAINKMLDHHVGAVAIVDNEYRVAGMFTERDVLRKMSLTGLDPNTTLVRQLMTTPVEMATRTTGPGEALSTRGLTSRPGSRLRKSVQGAWFQELSREPGHPRPLGSQNS